MRCASATRTARDIFARNIVLPQSLYARSSRPRSASITRERCSCRSTSSGCGRELAGGARRRPPRGGDRVPARLAASGARARGRALRARTRLRGGLGLARAVAAGALRHARRYHGRSTPTWPCRCAPTSRALQARAAHARSARRAHADAKQRRPRGRGALPRHGERAVRTCRRASIGMRWVGERARLPAAHRLRHGRHVHRRLADRRRAAAALRARTGGRAPHAADARRAQHRRRRGFRAGLPRRRACAVGPDSAGADPGPACYGRGRPARRSPTRRCCSGGCAPDTLPQVFGPRGNARDRHGGGARHASPRSPHRCGGRRAGTSHARDGRRILPRGRGRVDGQRHPPGVRAPGTRCRGLHAVLLRRRRRPARLPRGARRGPAGASSCTRWRASCPPSASASPTASRCAAAAGAAR